MYSSNRAHTCILFNLVFHIFCQKHSNEREKNRVTFLNWLTMWCTFTVFVAVDSYSLVFVSFSCVQGVSGSNGKQILCSWKVVHSLRAPVNQNLWFVFGLLFLVCFILLRQLRMQGEEGVKLERALMQLEWCSLRAIAAESRVITDVFDPTRNEEHRILNRGWVTQIYLLNRSCCFYVGFCILRMRRRTYSLND